MQASGINTGILREIGLTEHEIRIYLHLIEHGREIASKIARDLAMNRSLAYQVLESLIEKGIVCYSNVEKLKYFSPASPERLLEYISSKREELNRQETEVRKIIPLLHSRQALTGKEPQFEIYEGIEGWKSIMEDIIKSLKRGDEYYVTGLTGQTDKYMKHYYASFNRRRSDAGITRKSIINEKFIPLIRTQRETLARYLPKEHDMPLTTIMYADKVAMRFWVDEKPYALLITSKSASDSFRKNFMLLWEIAKPIPK